MTAREAVVKVLEEANEPLTTQEITKRAIDKKYWKTEGKTPEMSINALLSKDLKKYQETSVFVRIAPNTYGLRASKELMSPPAQIESVRSIGQLSFFDAARKVIERFGNQKPMHYKEITLIAFENSYLQTSGKTPEATMSATLSNAIKRSRKRGELATFISYGRGYFGLSKWQGQGVAFQAEQHNKKIRQSLKKKLHDMHFGEFEEFVGRFLGEIGFEEVEVTRRSNDKGIDVRGTLVIAEVIKVRMAVQVKKWKNNIQAPTVQQLRGSLGAHEHGLIITTSDFSKGAKEEAVRKDSTPIALMNGEQLVLLLLENEVGVQRTAIDLFDLEE